MYGKMDISKFENNFILLRCLKSTAPTDAPGKTDKRNTSSGDHAHGYKGIPEVRQSGRRVLWGLRGRGSGSRQSFVAPVSAGVRT